MKKRLKSLAVSLKLPFLDMEGTWEPDESERIASWEMYVELVTRLTVAELKPEEGLLREALTSFHALFDITRDILRRHGPSVARPKGGGDLSFGHLAVAVLNAELRPLLSRWHPSLLDWENRREANVSITEHERKWVHNRELREEMNRARANLIKYTNVLARVAEVPSLIVEDSE